MNGKRVTCQELPNMIENVKEIAEIWSKPSKSSKPSKMSNLKQVEQALLDLFSNVHSFFIFESRFPFIC